jgi:capsular exopolysaccharide synthesis family protein
MPPNPDRAPNPGSADLPMVIPRAGGTAIQPVSPPLTTAPDPIGLLKALRRCWLRALLGGVLLAAVVAGATYHLVPAAKFTAKAMLHVSSIPPRIVLQVREAVPDFGAYQRTQLALLKSRLVLNAALKQDSVALKPEPVAKKQEPMAKWKSLANKVDPIEWLAKEIQAEFPNGSEILTVSMSGDDPEELMAIVNAVTQAYLDEIANDETKLRRARHDLLKENWNRYQENLRGKRQELKKLTESVGSDDKKTLANIQQLELDRLGRVEDELARVQSELRRTNVELEVMNGVEDPDATTVTPAMIEEELAKDRSIENLELRMAQSKRAAEQASRLARNPGDPAVQKHRRDLEAAGKALADQRRKLYPKIERELRERARSDREAETALLRSRIKVLSRYESMLAGDVQRLADRSRSISRTAVDLSQIQEEIAAQEEVAKTIGNEVEALNVELQAPPRIRLLEKAELPRTKDELRPLRTAGMAGGAAFALALVAISFLEFRARRVDSPDDVVRGLGVRLVGTLPILPAGGRPLAADDPRSQRWQSLMIESVDSARTALLHASRTESVRVVMVASALGGEGKTSLACHLASSLARAGRQTLLVDGDMRCPTAHRLFDLPQDPGLSDVLRGDADWADVIRPTAVSRLDLIPAGFCDSEAIQALASECLRKGLDGLRERYDFVVIDSPPVLPVADALMIGQHVDGVILSVMRGVSRLPKVQTAFERMSSFGIRMLGAVVTGTRGDSYSSEYQYTYKYNSRSRGPA